MDPKAAAAMMANMSPEQRASMNQMMANMDPNVMANMARSMGGPAISADQVKQMQSKMSSGEVDINPMIDQVAKNPGMLDQMKQQQSASEQYMLSGATELKAQGNKLVKTKPAEAATLYNKAISNLTETGATSTAAATLMKACRLNLALCYLNTDKPDDAAEVCSTVLSSHPKDTKALYRRGLAYEKLRKLPESLHDFAKSADLSPGDDTVQQAKTRLQALVDALPEDKRKPAVEEAPAPAPEPTAPATAVKSAASTPAAKTPEEMMKENPEIAAAAQKMASENPEMVAKMQEVMMKSGVAPGVAATNPAAMKKMQAEMAKEMASNPGMAESMKSMMSSMPPEARKEMMKAQTEMMTSNPNMAAEMSKQTGMNINADQMKAATEMMGSMSPDAMEEMMKAAGPMMESMAKAQGSGGAGGMPGMPGMPAMGPGGMPDQASMAKMAESMQKDPKMMESMTKMMSSMSPEMLSKMSEQAGQKISPEQAKLVTEKMKDMTPDQMQKMMIWTQRLAAVVAFVKKVYDFCFGTRLNAVLTMAMIAIFLGWLFGYA